MLDGEKSQHHIYGIILAVIAIIALGGIVYVVSSADDVGQQVTINNTDPTITIAAYSDAECTSALSTLTLTEGTTSGTIYFCGTATDLNGEDEIDTAAQYDFSFYDSTDKNPTSSADDNDCYKQAAGEGIVLSNCSGTTCDYTVTMNDVKFHAEPTAVWKATMKVTDDNTAFATATTSNISIPELVAFSVTSSVNFGSVSLGGTSSQQTATFTNLGNVIADASQTASGAMTCTTIGSIPVGNVKRSFSDAFAYGDGVALTATSTSITDASIAKPTASPSNQTKSMYFLIQIPSNGVAGTCSNTVTFTAESNT